MTDLEILSNLRKMCDRWADRYVYWGRKGPQHGHAAILCQMAANDYRALIHKIESSLEKQADDMFAASSHDVEIGISPMTTKERQQTLAESSAILKTLDNPEAYGIAGVVRIKAEHIRNKKGEASHL